MSSNGAAGGGFPKTTSKYLERRPNFESTEAPVGVAVTLAVLNPGEYNGLGAGGCVPFGHLYRLQGHIAAASPNDIGDIAGGEALLPAPMRVDRRERPVIVNARQVLGEAWVGGRHLMYVLGEATARR